MSGTARYAYLHARVSVLAHRLLWHGRVEDLIGAAPAGADLTYRRVGLPADPLDAFPDPARLEQALLDLLLADAAILARPLVGADREILVYWIRRFELGNLKAIIRGRGAGRPPAWIREELLDVRQFARLPVEELLRTEDAAEMLRRLEATPYGEIARSARTIFEERHDLFALDGAVDQHYYAGLARRMDAMPASEKKPLQRLIGTIVDRTNLVWLLRYRFVYDLPPAQTYYLLVPGGYRLTGGDLLGLVRLGSVEEVIGALPERLRTELGAAETLAEVEQAMERAVKRTAWGIIRRTAFVVARAFAYLVVRERQLQQIHAVLRGNQLRLDEGEIRRAAGIVPLSPGG